MTEPSRESSQSKCPNCELGELRLGEPCSVCGLVIEMASADNGPTPRKSHRALVVCLSGTLLLAACAGAVLFLLANRSITARSGDSGTPEPAGNLRTGSQTVLDLYGAGFGQEQESGIHIRPGVLLVATTLRPNMFHFVRYPTPQRDWFYRLKHLKTVTLEHNTSNTDVHYFSFQTPSQAPPPLGSGHLSDLRLGSKLVAVSTLYFGQIHEGVLENVQFRDYEIGVRFPGKILPRHCIILDREFKRMYGIAMNDVNLSGGSFALDCVLPPLDERSAE